jgi:acyl carrier protein
MKKHAKIPLKKNRPKRIEDEIKAIIVELLALDIDPDEIEDQEMLFGGGLGLDSVKTLEIVSRMEEYYQIEVRDADVTEELFSSIQSLAKYVRKVKRIE